MADTSLTDMLHLFIMMATEHGPLSSSHSWEAERHVSLSFVATWPINILMLIVIPNFHYALALIYLKPILFI